MATITQHAPGTFCWFELHTTDEAGAKAFYTALFGWTIESNPMYDKGSMYHMLKVKGLDVGAAWLDPLLSTRAARRTVVLFFEPVAPSTSRRRIERDATRLATDAEQRANRGFRVGARHHRSRDAVEEREAELVAGYAEVGVVGLVVATAVTDNELDAAATQIGQAANAASLELRQLDGRHDLVRAARGPPPRGRRQGRRRCARRR